MVVAGVFFLILRSTLQLVCFLVESTPLIGTKMTHVGVRLLHMLYACAGVLLYTRRQTNIFIYTVYTYLTTHAFYTSVFFASDYLYQFQHSGHHAVPLFAGVTSPKS